MNKAIKHDSKLFQNYKHSPKIYRPTFLFFHQANNEPTGQTQKFGRPRITWHRSIQKDLIT